MARHGRGLWRLAVVSQCALIVVWQLSESFVQPAFKRRSVSAAGAYHTAHTARRAEGADKSADAPNPLVAVWRYIGGWYEIQESEGKLYFQENNLQGELVEQDGWLVAELPPAGTIRLKLGDSGEEVLSNFKPADAEKWGDTITALKEWESLTSRVESLYSDLDSSEFEGTAMDGEVKVKVNGRQRPVDLSFSKAASTSKALAASIAEAHSSAVDQSMEAMTARLQELYASHFSATKA
ncbi:unnamed protein product [Symbiodinium microadriaticum]|nr:unnamed protein product [Symbiodinium microadriaticum]CAE7948694.1 unnamed protein product [Symbiodinium sp. KB8]